MVQSSQQVWSTAEGAEPSRRPVGLDARAHSPPTRLDSDKFGDEAGDQTGGLIELCSHLNFSIAHINAQIY